MKASISFQIECGETTCAVVSGKFCRFCQLDVSGYANCFFFGGLNENADGWIARHKCCMSNAVDVESALQNALNELHGVRFIDNAFGEAERAKYEVGQIMRDLVDGIVQHERYC